MLFTDMEESASLRVILRPREFISLQSQLVFYWRASSEIPFLPIKTTLETIAGPLTTNLLLRSCTILLPRLATFWGS